MITIRGDIVLPGAGGTTTAADLLMEVALIGVSDLREWRELFAPRMQRASVRVADDCDARTAQKINHLVKHRLRIEGHRTTMMGECVALPAHITPECAANGRTAGLVDEETALLVTSSIS